MFGVLSIAGVAAIGGTVYAVDHSEVGVVIGLVGIVAVPAASPFLGLWLLTRKSALHRQS
jgi:hypothetical protein